MKRVAIVAVCALALTACASAAAAGGPVPDSLQTVWSGSTSTVYTMCDNGNRVYVVEGYKGYDGPVGIAVVPGSGCAR